ncbi:hypothetical protein RFI_17947 [Reticulomyxa filosa]|uniref:Uncharacterized protein n=1 Tax=Reticulomyxa filosa TaxID=46433 RepID=X6N059_RETFI|nr:hypothetical protein RFI_17947 [Reticulomyxa filosa]|eukprot:ETO19283.1 hypothetical protein RFI_17947 [Reticulomyxa filosa]
MTYVFIILTKIKKSKKQCCKKLTTFFLNFFWRTMEQMYHIVTVFANTNKISWKTEIQTLTLFNSKVMQAVLSFIQDLFKSNKEKSKTMNTKKMAFGVLGYLGIILVTIYWLNVFYMPEKESLKKTDCTPHTTEVEVIVIKAAEEAPLDKVFPLWPKIAIMTIAIGNYSYKEFSITNKKSYAMRHGYDLIIVEKATHSRHAAWTKITELEKLFSSNSTDLYDWIFVMDLDAFFVNKNIRLEELLKEAKVHKFKENWKHVTYHNTSQTFMQLPQNEQNPSSPTAQYFYNLRKIEAKDTDIALIMARDKADLNTGVMFWKNCVWSLELVRKIWDYGNYHIPKMDGWWEQAAIIWALEEDISLFTHFAVIDQNKLNSYPEGREGARFKPGDFIVHFPGAMKRFLNDWVQRLAFEQRNDTV